MWKEKIKHRKGKKKREKKMHTEGVKKNRHLIFLLSVRDKWENLKLISSTVNSLMKHNNFLCQFWGNLELKKMCSGEIIMD